MITFNIDKLNLRLVRVDMYLSQFDLNIRHKSDKDHVISNALSRLSSLEDENFTKKQNDDILNDINAYAEIIVEMSSTFKIQLIRVYEIDKK